MSNLKQRILSSIVGVLIFVPFVLLGESAFSFLIATIAIICANELIGILGRLGFNPYRLPVYLSSFLFIYLPVYFGEYGTVLTLSFLVLLAAAYSFFSKNKIANVSATIFTALYVGFLFGRLILLRQLDEGIALTFLVLSVIWANDIAAYLIGRRFGKKRLAPKISPKKTWEGTISGIFAAVIISLLFIFFTRLSVFELIIISIFVSTAGLLGDLFESQFKRWADVKDSGRLIPGHGGFLDRFDSLLFGAAAGYYVIQLFLL